jgi:acetoin utilization deacetylase AcuC-like enzyme
VTSRVQSPPLRPLRVVYSPAYEIDIGGHVFPTRKFAGVRRQLSQVTTQPGYTFVVPEPASWADLETVHDAGYLGRLRSGLSEREIQLLELPWSPDIVAGFRLMTGGTIEAGRLALADGLAGHIGGGFHHAFRDHGEGFCMFNDVAVAIRVLQREGRASRFAVVDCDVHHGNGTAAIFRGDHDVFAMSLHQWNNYPAEKPPSTLDVHLPDGIGDEEYLQVLEEALPHAVAFEPQLVFYLAGADPFRDDQLGGLGLSKEGLRARDRFVLRTLRDAGICVAITLAGGYAWRIEDTIAIHTATFEEALRVAGTAA